MGLRKIWKAVAACMFSFTLESLYCSAMSAAVFTRNSLEKPADSLLSNGAGFDGFPSRLKEDSNVSQASAGLIETFDYVWQSTPGRKRKPKVHGSAATWIHLSKTSEASAY